MNAFNIFQVSQFDETTFNNQITDFVDMLKDLKTKNPSLSNNELLELLKKKHTDFLQNMFSINSVRADVFRYHAIGELLSNPYEFKTLYEEVKNEIKNDPSLLELKQNLFFPLDLRECKKVHILDSIRVAHHEKQELLEAQGIDEKTFNRIDWEKTLKAKTRSDRDSVKILKRLQKPESTVILENTRDFYNQFGKKIKENYISLITSHYNLLDDLGIIPKMIEDNNSKIPDELHINKEYLDQYMSEENLKKLSFTELSALSSFYINKYTKLLQSYETGLFVLNEGYSIDELLTTDDPTIVVPEFNKRLLIRQKKILTSFSDDLLDKEYSKANSKENVEKGGSQFSADIDVSKYKKERTEFMSMFGIKKESEYYEKLKGIFQIRNITRNEYKLKDYSMLSNLSIILHGNNVENWGLIPDFSSGYDMNSDYILLGFDIKNLNMPLRLHMPSDMFKDFAREYMKTDLIPLYQGHEDLIQAFSDRGTYKRLPTFLLYSPTPEGKAYLKKETESIKDKEHPTIKEKLLAHLYMISDYTIPIADHLKEEIRSKKKSSSTNNKGKRQKGNQTPPSQGAKKKFIKKFLNIKTGQIETEKDLRIK